MHIYGEEIRLDPEVERVDLDEDDWAVNRNQWLMHNIGTELVFRIDVDESVKKSGAASIFDFSAKPVHIGAGHKMPSAEKMTELGRAAILLFLEAVGCFNTQPRPDGSGSDLTLN